MLIKNEHLRNENLREAYSYLKPKHMQLTMTCTKRSLRKGIYRRG
jgi:hypothetical protein